MKHKVVGLGEVLWDLLPAGPQLGGAPANFAYHARRLGADASIITRVGDDDLGRETLRRFDLMGIDRRATQIDPTLPTGSASVRVDGGGSPVFEIDASSAWDALMPAAEAKQVASGADAICFGSLAQRHKVTAQAIREILACAPANALRIFDVNLRQGFYNPDTIEQSLRIANILKLNNDELAVLAALFGLPGSSEKQLEHLADQFDLSLIALTCGEGGSVLFQSGAQSKLPARKVAVVDTIGAGDAFAAALAMGLLDKLPLAQTHRLATEVSSYVCSHAGATPGCP